MRRREFIASVAALGAWSASVRAQQPQRLRKLAIIMAAGKTPEYVAAVAALEQALGSLGWKNGENLQIDERWSAGSEDGARSAAREIVASNPDIILGQSAAVIEALQSATRTTPIVFLHVADPAVYGFVSNLARPEGNLTGITNIVPSIGAKWLQLLKEIAPAVTRPTMLVNPDTQPDRGAIFLTPFQGAARSLGRDRLPASFFGRESVEAGLLMSYGTSIADMFRQVAKPADLPVLQSTKFEFVINLQTARSLQINVPPTLLARAEGVIE